VTRRSISPAGSDGAGQVFQVHEAYIRLVDVDRPQGWNSRGHFFAAAAEAMRRILIDSARRKQADKHGGGRQRAELAEAEAVAAAPAQDLLALDEALDRLTQLDPVAGKLVKLCYFAGLSVEQAALALALSRSQAYRLWTLRPSLAARAVNRR
jgi:RNA polymerase sigma factor (TIGR02999 family)